MGDRLRRRGEPEHLHPKTGRLGQPNVTGHKRDVETPGDNHVEGVSDGDVVSHTPRLEQQRRRVDAANPEGEQVFERCLRIRGRHLTPKLDAPQGTGSLKMEVVRNNYLSSVQDLARKTTAYVGPQRDLHAAGGVEDNDRRGQVRPRRVLELRLGARRPACGAVEAPGGERSPPTFEHRTVRRRDAQEASRRLREGRRDL